MDVKSKPIRVAIVGVDERMRNALRLFFQGHCKNRCVMVEEDSAETGIIDLDAYQGEDLYVQYRQRHPDHPIILISLNEKDTGDSILLKKPLNAKDLISALAEAKKRIPSKVRQMSDIDTSSILTEAEGVSPSELVGMESEITSNKKKISAAPEIHLAAMYLGEQSAKAIIGSAPDIDPDDLKQVANAQYDPDDFLQGQLMQACMTADDKNRCVRINTSRGPIYIYPNNQDISLELSDSHLRTLSVVPLGRDSLSIEVLKKDCDHELKDSVSQSNREILLWKTAIWASRGRVPIETKLDTPIFLRHWPNMTRLMLFPHALRIAALWTSQPYSLLDTAKILGISQRYVFSLYSASHALGLAATSQRAVDTLIEPPAIQKNRKHSLMERIINRLRVN